MNYYSRQPMWRQALNKRAVAILTPEAMQAAMQPPPPDPAAMGGAPMDPAMAGGQPPMDPAMMGGGAPMPPGGAPMDPSMAGGLPPEALQDQLFLQFLAEAFGIMMDPRSGQFFDQNGQPVPPDMLMQAYDAYMQGMQQLQGQGGMPPMDPAAMGGQPPMDPAMAGGQPPMDPAAMGGASLPPPGGMPPMDPSMMGGAPMPPQGGMPPMDPAAMGGQPPMDAGMPPQEGGEQPMDPMMADFASMIVSAMEDTVVTPLKEELANIMKQFNDLKEMMKTMRDDMGTIRTDVDAQESRADEDSVLRSELAAELQPTIEQAPEEPQEKQAALRPLNILDILGSK